MAKKTGRPGGGAMSAARRRLASNPAGEGRDHVPGAGKVVEHSEALPEGPVLAEVLDALQVMVMAWNDEAAQYGRQSMGLGDDVIFPAMRSPVQSVEAAAAVLHRHRPDIVPAAKGAGEESVELGRVTTGDDVGDVNDMVYRGGGISVEIIAEEGAPELLKMTVRADATSYIWIELTGAGVDKLITELLRLRREIRE